jgi:hypothetical protein
MHLTYFVCLAVPVGVVPAPIFMGGVFMHTIVLTTLLTLLISVRIQPIHIAIIRCFLAVSVGIALFLQWVITLTLPIAHFPIL